MQSSSPYRVALVTGASRGIGKACALGLARDGFDVVVNDIERQREVLDTTKREIEALGRKSLAVIADVSQKAEVQAMVAAAIAAFGQVDAVLNNAGILITSPIETLDEALWDRTMAVNAKGQFLVTQALLPHMRARKYGRIVNIASIGGKQGAPEQAHYSASKAAIMGFTRVLAQEVGKYGITANCVCPGIIYTDMGRTNLDDPAVQAQWVKITALGRVGQPEDVVGAVCFFASDAAAFITGQTLNVCGGIVLS
jgi:3-oxoacyl-[acyl-carrier protein] reductase